MAAVVVPTPVRSNFACSSAVQTDLFYLLPAIVRPMFSLPLSTLRPSSAAWLILGLAASADLVLSPASFAAQPNSSPCQKAAAASSPVAAAAGSPSTDLLLAQALPSQPIGVELGEPACTYDPVVPAQPQLIRGLW